MKNFETLLYFRRMAAAYRLERRVLELRLAEAVAVIEESHSILKCMAQTGMPQAVRQGDGTIKYERLPSWEGELTTKARDFLAKHQSEKKSA